MNVPTRLVVFGEALTDFIREGESTWRSVPGGSPWNMARAAARLGVRTGYAGALSRDLFGEELMRLTREAGLDLRFTQQVDRSPLLAMVVEKHPPRYFFVGDDSANLNYDPGSMPPGWLEQAEIVHFGSISLARPPHAARLLAIAERAREAGRRIAFDPNHRVLMEAAHYRPVYERMASLADYLKLSDEDLSKLYPGATREAALAEVRAVAPGAWILFTEGAIGMRLLTPGRELFQPGFAVEVADTVGAGDASMGGWMASLLLQPGAPLEAHAAFAAATAAVCCQHAGAYAPTHAEVVAFLSAAAEAGRAS